VLARIPLVNADLAGYRGSRGPDADLADSIRVTRVSRSDAGHRYGIHVQHFSGGAGLQPGPIVCSAGVSPCGPRELRSRARCPPRSSTAD